MYPATGLQRQQLPTCMDNHGRCRLPHCVFSHVGIPLMTQNVSCMNSGPPFWISHSESCAMLAYGFPFQGNAICYR